jgi:hypothetical protein
MDEEGSVLTIQGERTVAAFEATLKTLHRLVELRGKARSGDAAAELEVALLEGDLDMIAFDELQKRVEGKKLSAEQTALVGEIEMRGLIGAVRNARQDPDAANAAAKKLAEAYAAGRVPASKGQQETLYFIVFQHALSEADPDLAQKAFDAAKALVKERVGADPGFDTWVKGMQDKIDDVRAQKEGGCGGDEGIEIGEDK